MDDIKSVAWFHIHASPQGLRIAFEQLSVLHNSGLWNSLDFLAIGLVGKEAKRGAADIKAHYPDRDIRIVICQENEKEYELPTLNALYLYSQKNPGIRVLYFHTKGTRPYKGPVPRMQNDWRRMMMYFLTYRCQDCWILLKKYLAVGLNLTTTRPCPIHFSGNFWWTWTDHISKLYDLSSISWTFNNRFFAEYWVCSRDPNKLCSIHNSNIDHYLYYYPVDKYINTRSMECVFKGGNIVDIGT